MFDSIKINKNEIEDFVIDYPRDIYRRDLEETFDEDMEIYLEEDENLIKITKMYIENNPDVFR